MRFTKVFPVFFILSLLIAFSGSSSLFAQARGKTSSPDTVIVYVRDTVVVHDTVWIKNGIMYNYNPEPYTPPKEKHAKHSPKADDNPVNGEVTDVITDNTFRMIVDSLFTTGVEFNRDSLSNIILYNDPAFKYDWKTTEVHYSLSDFSKIPDRLRFELLRGNEKFYYNWYGSLTWGFGPRWGRMHKGIDTFLEQGDSLFATFNGIVRYAEFNQGGYGNCVVIRHFNGLESLYAHLSKLNVKPGQLVQTGELIGLAGSTGRSDGPHLHFETRYSSYPFDPLLILDKDKSLELLDTVFVLNKSQLLNDGSTGIGAAINYITGKSTPKAKYHKVRSGETLYSIAKKHKISVESLAKMNKIKNRNKLSVGQNLRVR